MSTDYDHSSVFDAEEWADMCGLGRGRKYQPGETLFHEGDETDFVVLIKAGVVQVTSAAMDGYTSILAQRGPGEVVGEFALIDGQPRSATVSALTAVRSVVVTAQRFRSLLDARPVLTRKLLNTVVQRIRQADRQRKSYPYPATHRVANALVEQAMADGHLVASGSRPVTVVLAQHELAGRIGISRETVVRALRTLEERRLLERRGGSMVLTDLNGLASLLPYT